MRIGEIGWCICLAGLPFALYLTEGIFHLHMDIWHAQTAWMQGWILVLWSGAWLKGQTLPLNRSLAAFVGWVSLWVWWTSVISIPSGHYAVGLLMPAWHLMFLVLAYHAAMVWWTPRFLTRLLTILAWSGVLMLVYTGLQCLSLDQFFKNLDGNNVDEIVGSIGNPSHLAAWVSFVLPVWLWREGWFWKGIVALSLLLLIRLHSSIALATSGLVVLTYGWSSLRNHWRWMWAGGCGLLGSLYVVSHWSDLWNLHGRGDAWAALWNLCQHGPIITGFGPGFLMEQSQTITAGPLLHWRHAHNEFFQAGMEYGLIGLGLLCWMLWETIQRWRQANPSSTRTILAWMGLAFLLNCTVNWPGHLWALGIFGLIAYAGLHVLAEST